MMNFANGEYYNGDWAKDEICGSGKYCDKNKDVYKGEWVKNKKHG